MADEKMIEVVEMDLEDLRLDFGNPRDATAGDIEELKESLRAFNDFGVIVINEENQVIAGSQRVRAMLDLGWKKVHCKRLVGFAKAEQKAINVRANRHAGKFNNDQLVKWIDEIAVEGVDLSLTGYNPVEVDDMRIEMAPEPIEIDDDEIPEAPQPVTKDGDVWELGRHRVMCGDSTIPEHVEKLIRGEQIDSIITDPPYCSGGFQEGSRSKGSIGTERKVKEKTVRVRIANDILSTRGYKALVKKAIFSSKAITAYVFTDWRMWVNLYDVSEESGYGVRSMIVWNKETPGMGLGWRAQHEIIMYSTRATINYNRKKAMGNVITMKRTGNVNHPTEKPVDLICKFLYLMDMAAVVYDPFIGSGSTLIACEKYGKNCYGMELDPRYCDVVVKRYVGWCTKAGKTCTVKLNGQPWEGEI